MLVFLYCHPRRNRKLSSSSSSSTSEISAPSYHPKQTSIEGPSFEPTREQIDSNEIIQQLDDHLDETDNILMRTSEQAVAESIADLAREPILGLESDMEEQDQLLGSQDQLTGSGVTIDSLKSSDGEEQTQVNIDHDADDTFYTETQ